MLTRRSLFGFLAAAPVGCAAALAAPTYADATFDATPRVVLRDMVETFVPKADPRLYLESSDRHIDPPVIGWNDGIRFVA